MRQYLPHDVPQHGRPALCFSQLRRDCPNVVQARTDISYERLDLCGSFVRDSQHELVTRDCSVMRPTAASSLGRLVIASSRVLG